MRQAAEAQAGNYGGCQKSCITLGTSYLGNDGTIAYQAQAGFLVSTEVLRVFFSVDVWG